jgi:hypothetical protein
MSNEDIYLTVSSCVSSTTLSYSPKYFLFLSVESDPSH